MIRIYKSGKQAEQWRKCAQEVFDYLPETENSGTCDINYEKVLDKFRELTK